jgi:hypothetical protein
MVCSRCPSVLQVQYLRWRHCSGYSKRTAKSRKIARNDLLVKWKCTLRHELSNLDKTWLPCSCWGLGFYYPIRWTY